MAYEIDLSIEDLPDPRDEEGMRAFIMALDGYSLFQTREELFETAKRAPRDSIASLVAELFVDYRASNHQGSGVAGAFSKYRELYPYFVELLGRDKSAVGT